MIRTLALLTALSAVAIAAPALAAPAPAPAPACPATDITLGRGVDAIQITHGVKGADGESHFEPLSIPGETKSFYGGKTKLTQFDLGDPTRVMLVYGFPNIEIPKHPSPYREMFILLSGSTIATLPDGSSHELGPGSILLSDDQGTPGRGGRAGPCGYVALDLQFKAAPAPPK